jgi:hypothetical protein
MCSIFIHIIASAVQFLILCYQLFRTWFNSIRCSVPDFIVSSVPFLIYSMKSKTCYLCYLVSYIESIVSFFYVLWFTEILITECSSSNRDWSLTNEKKKVVEMYDIWQHKSKTFKTRMYVHLARNLQRLFVALLMCIFVTNILLLVCCLHLKVKHYLVCCAVILLDWSFLIFK